MTPYVIPRLEDGKAEVGGPGYALSPRWWKTGQDVTVRCMCGHLVSLPGGAEGHVIDAKGNVSPSIECPTASCGWHVFAQLENWDGGLRV